MYHRGRLEDIFLICLFALWEVAALLSMWSDWFQIRMAVSGKFLELRVDVDSLLRSPLVIALVSLCPLLSTNLTVFDSGWCGTFTARQISDSLSSADILFREFIPVRAWRSQIFTRSRSRHLAAIRMALFSETWRSLQTFGIGSLSLRRTGAYRLTPYLNLEPMMDEAICGR